MDADSDQACLRNFGAIPGQANPLISVNGRYLSQSEEVRTPPIAYRPTGGCVWSVGSQ